MPNNTVSRRGGGVCDRKTERGKKERKERKEPKERIERK
jgi:hypothetical protein